MNDMNDAIARGYQKTSPNVFTVQRCLVLESKRQIASKRDYFKEKIIEIALKVTFLFRLDSTVKGKTSKFNVEFAMNGICLILPCSKYNKRTELGNNSACSARFNNFRTE